MEIEKNVKWEVKEKWMESGGFGFIESGAIVCSWRFWMDQENREWNEETHGEDEGDGKGEGLSG